MENIGSVQNNQQPAPIPNSSESSVKEREPEKKENNNENGHKFTNAKIIDVTG